MPVPSLFDSGVELALLLLEPADLVLRHALLHEVGVTRAYGRRRPRDGPLVLVLVV